MNPPGFFAWVRGRVAPIAGKPDFFKDSAEDILKNIAPDGLAEVDQTASQWLMQRAEWIARDAESTIESAERRATTLLGAVAIAASLTIAGGGLALDPQKIASHGLRLVVALAVASVVLSLCASGIRALQVLTRLHYFNRPAPEDLPGYAKLAPPEGQVRHSVDLLRSWGVNTKIAEWKVAHLGAAGWWFRWALLGLVVLSALMVYATVASS